jgi:hypothetical protein
MKLIVMVVSACASLLLIEQPVLAAGDGLDARTHAKVMRAKRAQAMDAQDKGAAGQPYRESCGSGANIGNVYTDRSNRGTAPRENTVVVTGDVIVLPGRNCR